MSEKNFEKLIIIEQNNGAVRIRHSIREFATQPVILWILLGGKPKWFPLNFGFNDVMRTAPIGLASDDVTKLSNAWQRGKLVLNKGSVTYKSMLGEKSLTWRSSLFLRGKVRTVLATPSLLSASHFKIYWGSDKCGAVFRSIDDLPACFCMGRYLCLEPNLPVATPVAGLWRSTCKPYWKCGQKLRCGQFRTWPLLPWKLNLLRLGEQNGSFGYIRNSAYMTTSRFGFFSTNELI